MRLACLPWYDLAELRDALDGLWQAIARGLMERGVDRVPALLERNLGYEEQWESGRLLLGQACGYDAVFGHADRLRIVATPHFCFPGCDGPSYRSFVVVRRGQRATTVRGLRGLRCTINTPTSHSGMNALRSLVAPLHQGGRFFGSVCVSGSHEASLAMLQSNAADVASIDCVTYGLLQRHRPTALRGTRVIGQTRAAPAPPFVTSSTTPQPVVRALRGVLHEVLRPRDRPAAHHRLGLRAISSLDAEDYRPIADLAAAAAKLDYRELPGRPTFGFDNNRPGDVC